MQGVNEMHESFFGQEMQSVGKTIDIGFKTKNVHLIFANICFF